MSSINKNTNLIASIGIIAIIVGYLFLLYKGYNLDKDILKKQDQVKVLDTLISKLRIDSMGLTKNNSHLNEKIKETDSTIALASGKSNSIEQLRKELGIPKDTYFTQTSKNARSIENAKKYEAEGFEYLLDKNIDSAIASFTKSENSYNGYHLVYDLSKYLTKNKTELIGNPGLWKSIYQKILFDYSWGMPKQFKTEFQTALK